MKIYAIADLHLSLNPGVDKPMDIFGVGWENHHERLKKNWEALVNEEDVVIIPGDVSWGLKLEEAMTDFEWISQLPGKKLIFKGNHDLWWKGIKKINNLFMDIKLIQNDCYFIAEENLAICGTRGWISPGLDGFDGHDLKIYKREIIRLKFSLEEAKKLNPDKIIVALHYPPSNEGSSRSEQIEIFKEYGVDYCIYGHLHGSHVFPKGIKGNYDNIEYKLVSLDYLKAKPLLIYDSKGGFNYESYVNSTR